ncbi:long-chain acyl-CoA synthetase [Schistosoma bovis]|uniref:long-chain-fatty-acid--CoA ligase n=1 Tax=Schistosoma bovis TaxID=6184 RepID=A0A430QAH3_SCHBO|nr:long-chain acyl-CoA synthetase [Schistosoma bovis]
MVYFILFLDEKPNYPDIYMKIHEPNQNGSFFSSYLNQQSVIADPKVDEKIQAFGSALVGIMKKYPESERFVGVYGRNSPQWFITQYACFCYSYTVVPLYATLGDPAMQHILKQTGLVILMCHSADLAIKILENFNSSLKVIIIAVQDQSFEDLKAQYSSSVNIYSFDEFSDLGRSDLKPKIPPAEKDLCLICYTSGSTGHITVASWTSDNNHISESEHELPFLKTTSLFIAFAFTCLHLQAAAVFCGGQIGFLTGAITGLLDDAQALKPTVLPAVPRVLSRIYERYQNALGNSFLKRYLYEYTLKRNLKILNSGKINRDDILDTLFFKKLRQALGGRVCMIVTGGAPISPELFNFFRAAFKGLVGHFCSSYIIKFFGRVLFIEMGSRSHWTFIVAGYGSTEVSGVTSVTVLGESHEGTVGAITSRIEVKLADVLDMDIVALRDNRGEICIKGKRCTKGYFQDPESTAQIIDADGWLHTGDIGEWTTEGALKIVDRVKSMFKLAQGEYVAPEKIEVIYQNCQLIDQIFVDGKPEQNFPVAVVTPNFVNLRSCINSYLKSGCNVDDGKIFDLKPSDISRLSDTDICKNIEIRRFVLRKMNEVATEKGLKIFEMVQSIYLNDNPFTVENGLLTPTMKISRQNARRHFQSIVESLYSERDVLKVNA